MRKIISLIIAAAITISVFCCIEFSGIALESGGDFLTEIDFDVEAAGKYSNYMVGANDGAAFIDLNDGSHENVYVHRLTRPRSQGPQRNYFLRNSASSDNSVLTLGYGKKYKITFSYKNVYTTADYVIAIRWCANTDEVQSLNIPDGTYTDITGVLGSTSEGNWTDVSYEITPPKDYLTVPVLVVYTNHDSVQFSQIIYFDNITVAEQKENYSDYTVINFDEEAAGNYSNYMVGANDGDAFMDLNDGSHENVYVHHLTRPRNQGPQRNYVLRDSASADNASVTLRYKTAYTISLSYKNVYTTADYVIAIRWCAKTDDVQGLNIPDGTYTDIVGVGASTSEGDWNTVYAEITPPKDTLLTPSLVIYTNNDNVQFNQIIYIDNITIAKAEDSYSSSTFINFDQEAEGGYSYHKSEVDQELYTVFPNLEDGVHNNVYALYLTRPTNQSPHRGYVLRNSNSSLNLPLKLKYGSDYNISFSYKAVKMSQAYTLAIWWVSSPASVTGNFTYRSKYSTPLKVIPTGTEEDGWISVTSIISPPDEENAYPVLVAYTNDLNNKTEIVYFDDISVSECDGENDNELYDSSCTVDFDSNSQPSFFNSSRCNVTYKLYGGDDTNFVIDSEEHGTVALIDRINSSTSLGQEVNVVSNIRTIGLCNTDGTAFANFESGAQLEVSVDLNVKGCTTDNLYVGIAFADGTPYSAGGIGQGVQYGGLYRLSKNGMLLDVAKVDTSVEGWQTVTGKIAVPTHSVNETAWIVLYSKTEFEAMYTTGQSIYLDNISVTVSGRANSMTLETNGGSTLSQMYFVSGSEALYPKAPSKSGCDFAGWYYDSALTLKCDYSSPMPDKDITLYAKWQDLSEIEAATLKTGFEQSDYNGGVIPYTNIGENCEISSDNVTDELNSFTATVYKDSALGAYEGEGYIELDNRFTEGGEGSKTSSAALLNSDGSSYYFVAGQRYHVTFAIQSVSPRMSAEGGLLCLVASSYTPESGIDNVNSTVLYKFSTLSTDFSNQEIVVRNKWGYYDVYFEATVTGRGYFTFINNIRPSDNNASGVKIDSLTIEPVEDDEAVKITYKSDDGKKTYATQYAAAGESVKESCFADTRSDYVFDGWRLEDGTLFDFENIPRSDVTVYASYKASDGEMSVDWDESITSDFESQRAEIFYQDRRNISATPINGMDYVSDDSQNAHSGSAYFKFSKNNGTKAFKIYAEDTPDNYIWLDANSEYLVTYYINVTDMPSTVYRIILSAGAFPSAGSMSGFYSSDSYSFLESDKQGEWIKVSQRITTLDSQSVLGIQMERGPATVLIDDITVKKLVPVTVSFNSNGGSSVDDIEVAVLSYAVEPEYPVRNGYVFAGWYTDSALTKAFSFNDTAIEDNLTLYAKWTLETVEELKQEEKKYMTVYDTEYRDQIVENDLSGYGLDDVPELKSADAVKAITKGNEKTVIEESGFPWWILIVIAIVILAVMTVIIIVAKRKRHQKQ